MRDAGLEQAIKAAGGISALARRIGVAQPSISNWSRVPAERVLAVEAITAVPRGVLRPDLYPETVMADIDPVDQARGNLYLLLANLLQHVPQPVLLADIAALPPAGEGPVGEAVAALAEAARGVDATGVAREHFELFIGVGRGELVPYGSYYLTGFLYERPLARVREDLAIVGLERTETVREPEDGIGFLCEVMAGLALGRFQAAETFQRTFFERNIAPWAAKFFSDLEAAEAAKFYRCVGRLGRIFMELEREAFALDTNTAAGAGTRQDNVQEATDDRQAS